MSSLHFHYGVMSASKSTKLITDWYNFHNNNIKVLVLKPRIDSRISDSVVRSRLGIECPADIVNHIKAEDVVKIPAKIILIDEVQFFSKNDIDELVILCDYYKKIVMTYGLLVDINENLFPASRRLIEVGAKLHELKTNCQIKNCMNIANHHIRFNKNGTLIPAGDSVVIDDGSVIYKSVCRQHYNMLTEKYKGR